jgi:hypothetical protein
MAGVPDTGSGGYLGQPEDRQRGSVANQLVALTTRGRAALDAHTKAVRDLLDGLLGRLRKGCGVGEIECREIPRQKKKRYPASVRA